MKNNKLQTKDINKLPILILLKELNGKWATLHYGFENSVTNAFPQNTPENLVLSVMKNLVKRGYVNGCTCGCRGDFVITTLGNEVIEFNKEPDINDLF